MNKNIELKLLKEQTWNDQNIQISCIRQAKNGQKPLGCKKEKENLPLRLFLIGEKN